MKLNLFEGTIRQCFILFITQPGILILRLYNIINYVNLLRKVFIKKDIFFIKIIINEHFPRCNI